MKLAPTILGLLLSLDASVACTAEPELLADVQAAQAAGYRIIDLRPRPSDEYSRLVTELIPEFARSQGIDRPVNADWASVRLPSGQEVLLISPRGAEFDKPGTRSGRLLVYAVQGRGAKLVLDTSAMRVGVDETGFRAFQLQQKP